MACREIPLYTWATENVWILSCVELLVSKCCRSHIVLDLHQQPSLSVKLESAERNAMERHAVEY